MFVYLPLEKAFQLNTYITFQFLIIGIVSAIGMIIESSKYSFTLGMVFWFFCFAFMFCGGLTQFATEAFRWDLKPSLKEVEITNYLIFIWIIVFSIARKVNIKIKCGSWKKRSIFEQKLYISNTKILFLTVMLICNGIYTIIVSGWRSLLIREVFSTAGVIGLTNIQSIQMILSTFLRGFSIWTMMIALNNLIRIKNKSNIAIFILATIAIGLNVPPSGVARFVLAAAYGGILIYNCEFLKKGRTLLYILAVGLLIVFPLLNAFRGIYTTSVNMEFIKQSLGNISSNFAKADYDAYTMLVYSVRYVSKYGIRHGQQLWGVLLFFIPSSLWENKPSGSGAMIIEKMASGINPNVSCPIIAEGFINFGIIGIIIFAFLAGYITKRLDLRYWECWENKNSMGKMIYSFLLLYFLFLCRGDLMSTFTYLLGYLFSAILFRRIVK